MNLKTKKALLASFVHSVFEKISDWKPAQEQLSIDESLTSPDIEKVRYLEISDKEKVIKQLVSGKMSEFDISYTVDSIISDSINLTVDAVIDIYLMAKSTK